MTSVARIRSALAGLHPRFIAAGGYDIAHVAALRSVALAVNAGTGLISAVFLGPQGRGEQAAMILAPQALAGLATLGLHASLIYNIKADPEHERQYIAVNLLLTLTFGIIAVAIGWFIEPLWLSKFDPDVIEKARLFLFLTPINSAGQTFIAVLESRAQFGAANRAVCLQSICALAILGALVVARQVTPVTAAGSYAFSNVLAFFYLGACVKYRIDKTLRLPFELACRLIHYGLRFYGVDVITVTAGYLDQIIIAAFLSPAALGAYVVALSLCRLLGVLPSAAETVIFPSVAAQKAKTAIDTVASAVRVLTVINVLSALILALLGPHLIALFFGAKFAASSGPLIVLLIATVPASAVSLLYKGYAGSGRPGIVTIIHGIGLALSFGAMVLLVPHYGTLGAAYSVLLSALMRLVLALIGMPLFLGVPVPRIILSRQDFAWVRGRFAQ